MPKPAKDVAASLTKKGFHSHHSDHQRFYLHVEGKKTAVRTMISHSAKEIDDNLLSLMARQVKLNKKLFADLIDCPLSQEQYVKLLREGGHVSRPDSGKAT